jgi:hypothetical protein
MNWNEPGITKARHVIFHAAKDMLAGKLTSKAREKLLRLGGRQSLMKMIRISCPSSASILKLKLFHLAR